MRRFLLAVALVGSGLTWLIACAIFGPLARAMRVDHRTRRDADVARAEVGYDDNDPGADVDSTIDYSSECDRCGRCRYAPAHASGCP